jgi:pimeloyl-ACP methyl ester carboxylesterase
MKPSMTLHLALIALLAAVLTSCASAPASQSRTRGTLKSADVLQTISRDAINAGNSFKEISGPARCDVEVIQLTYESVGIHGEPETLSAGLFVPERCEGPFPLIAQAHGTRSERDRLTTEVGPQSDTVTFFAARGYLVVAPDYLGLGKSDFPFHPYLHAESEASAIIDSIRAARSAARKLDVKIGAQVMLFGYSQGGHAAMAAQREIERHYSDEIHLSASAPMAGPYYLSQTIMGSWFGYTAGQQNLMASELLAYVIVSLNRTYGTIYREPDQVFAEQYARNVEPLFSGSQSIVQILTARKLPAGGKLNELRTPAFTAAFLREENHPLRVALKRNDLLDWSPKTPTLLCGSRRDAIVDFQNAYAAQAAFRASGADVPVVDIADSIPASANGMAHHNDYAYLCYAKARQMLFDPLVEGKPLAYEWKPHQ